MICSDELSNRSSSTAELTERQRVVLSTIARYNAATGEACSLSYVSRRLGLHHSTVHQHVRAIHRKGWLRGPNSPAFARINHR